MQPYTVLLLYPDTLAETYGQETYLAHVEADDSLKASQTAQELARLDTNEAVDDPDDFYPLIVIAGHHDDLLYRR